MILQDEYIQHRTDVGQAPVVGDQRLATVDDAGGGLQGVGRTQSVGGPELRSPASDIPIDINDGQIREMDEQRFVMSMPSWTSTNRRSPAWMSSWLRAAEGTTIWYRLLTFTVVAMEGLHLPSITLDLLSSVNAFHLDGKPTTRCHS